MTGLRQRILAATSEEEVKKLVEEGKTYEFASRATRNSWKHAAHRRLTGKQIEVSEDASAEGEPVKKARKRKK